jgi:1-acyl-sn-glycerol-3-phosphate acyltransferase
MGKTGQRWAGEAAFTRWLRCVRAACALLAVLAMAVPWALLPVSSRCRRRVADCGWSVLLAGFGIRLVRHGAPAWPGPTLFVANHVSWIDIAALARLTDAGFVAKAEIGRWPVIGALARRLGCVFVTRGVRSGAREQARLLTERLRERAGMIVFPEGTTGDGKALQPFASSLFAAAGEAGWASVQPVAIRFFARDGTALDDAGRRAVAWLGDDALLPHAFALAARGGVIADVSFLDPVARGGRKELASRCAGAIAARLAQAGGGGQAVTLKRAA